MAHRRPFLKPDLPRVCIPEVTLLSLLPLQSYRIAAAVLLPGAYLYYRRHCVSSACRRFHSLRPGFPLGTTFHFSGVLRITKPPFLFSGSPEASFAPGSGSFHHREAQRPQGRPGHLHTERKGANPADQSGSNHPPACRLSCPTDRNTTGRKLPAQPYPAQPSKPEKNKNCRHDRNDRSGSDERGRHFRNGETPYLKRAPVQLKNSRFWKTGLENTQHALRTHVHLFQIVANFPDSEL